MPESGETVYLPFISPSSLSDGVAVIYKNNGTTESSAGVTLTPDFDSTVGQNLVIIDTSADGAFYINGGQFWVKITATAFMQIIPFTLESTIRDVRLADGVAHGGVPGSSTATLAMKNVNIYNNSGDGINVNSSGGTAMTLYGSVGMLLQGSYCGLMVTGIEVDPAGANQASILVYGPNHVAGPAVQIDNTELGGIGLQILPGGAAGVDILATDGSKAILLRGDAATDAFAIAAGASSPIDVFDAEGRVKVNIPGL